MEVLEQGHDWLKPRLYDQDGPPGAKSRFLTVRERLLVLSKRIMCRIT
jgi:hypothetical protein